MVTSGHSKGAVPAGERPGAPGSEIARAEPVLRITELELAAGRGLRVEGRLAGAWVGELRQVCERHRPWRLDLRGLQTADADGLTLLRQLAHDGIALEHLSGYLAAILAEPP